MMLSSLLLTLSLLRVGKPPHGPPIPGDVACNAKLLAYEFAVSLQPERDARGLAVIVSTLYFFFLGSRHPFPFLFTTMLTRAFCC